MANRRPDRTLRIIGGNWRSRKVSFPDRDLIRPTPDRVRETLFNWLQSDITGARCLELYAGSGILSMEALSRGAMSATLIENDEATVRSLAANLSMLCTDADRYHLVCASAQAWLARCETPFDVVFLDPPFESDELDSVLSLLVSRRLVPAHGLVYIESSNRVSSNDLPHGLGITKQKSAGRVHYCLAASSGPRND